MRRKLGRLKRHWKRTHGSGHSQWHFVLDEIGKLFLDLQAKLLRVIQEKEVMRVGGNKIIKVNFRVIAATNKNLLREVEKGHFRQDHFYRFNYHFTYPL
ncbi:sigma 54-interacting transcriptional regulator [Fusibacter sp. 3D3]|uniref:sigma 54-interacting transcriptional regulator n=1 Tax=Fusibacter sp. 3D3 TaxID=1048380 RepID=UPI000852D319|nr:sigma 54-interacting transcriptional regulator [Fusibacter sp. 3D3]GAU76563.1 formate hydrogenlyase transcriptionalactivator [Fusibacter sp. 3D3]